MVNLTEQQFQAVLDHYPVDVQRVTVETCKDKKAVWWVDTTQGKFVLKCLTMTKDRVIFLLSAIGHLKNGGVNIPTVLNTKDGAPLVENEGKIYLLLEALVGKTPSYEVPSELAMIMEGMALFHRASRGFIPPADGKVRNHLGTWKKIYQDTVSDLVRFKTQALVEGDHAFSQYFLTHCDRFMDTARACLKELENPAYHTWVTKVRQEVNLCHQDFAGGNLGIVQGQLVVYDMDSITVDLPARDIRKIFNKVMKKRGDWSKDVALHMLRHYQKINPLSREELEVVFIDVMFPHLFYGISSKYFDQREKEWPEQKYLNRLRDLTRTELSKEVILKERDTIINQVLEGGS